MHIGTRHHDSINCSNQNKWRAGWRAGLEPCSAARLGASQATLNTDAVGTMPAELWSNTDTLVTAGWHIAATKFNFHRLIVAFVQSLNKPFRKLNRRSLCLKFKDKKSTRYPLFMPVCPLMKLQQLAGCVLQTKELETTDSICDMCKLLVFVNLIRGIVCLVL